MKCKALLSGFSEIIFYFFLTYVFSRFSTMIFLLGGWNRKKVIGEPRTFKLHYPELLCSTWVARAGHPLVYLLKNFGLTRPKCKYKHTYKHTYIVIGICFSNFYRHKKNKALSRWTSLNARGEWKNRPQRGRWK